MEWDYTASHKTRGYIVQMTKAEFTFENRLKHDDLEEIYSELSDKFPY
ncbi:lytic polysaccharide monooxygenase auxiliary activity family 9 protein [Rickettsia hoogstraalii]|nr:hypothetical protein [Rickettsia hoogstraalii]